MSFCVVRVLLCAFVSHRNQCKRSEIGDYHTGQVYLRFGSRSSKFMPYEDAPQRCNHRRCLPDRVRDGQTDLASGYKIQYGASSPDEASKQAPDVIAERRLEIALHGYRRADQRFTHQDRIEDEAADEGAQSHE